MVRCPQTFGHIVYLNSVRFTGPHADSFEVIIKGLVKGCI